MALTRTVVGDFGHTRLSGTAGILARKQTFRFNSDEQVIDQTGPYQNFESVNRRDAQTRTGPGKQKT
jgi:hypothetical protein